MNLYKISIVILVLSMFLCGCSRNYNHTSDKNMESAEGYYFKQGMDSLARKNAVEAVPNFSEVIRINPKAADAYYQRARIYQAAGFDELWAKDFDSAKNYSEKYRKMETLKPLEFKLTESEIEILKPVAVPADAAIVADKPASIDN